MAALPSGWIWTWSWPWSGTSTVFHEKRPNKICT